MVDETHVRRQPQRTRPYRLVRDGALLRVEPLPTADELKAFYEHQYFQENLGTHAPAYAADELAFINFRNRVLHALICRELNVTDLRGRTLLDIGAGEGFTLRYFHDLGVKVAGADFSKAGIERHNPDLLSHFVQCDVNTLPLAGPFDFVVLNGVLEHVRDPRATITSIKSHCHPATLLFVLVPNEFNRIQMEYLGDAPLESAPWFCPPEHLSYFEPQSLRAILAEAGYDPLYLGAGFPIETFLFDGATDYYKDRTKGAAAHHARKRFINVLSQDMNGALDFCAALASANIGRELMMLARPIVLAAR
jgi:2-polyprenyl-3-methyl-5-hydroxy-6-metoxy-1,4-benzoquinol methylase